MNVRRLATLAAAAGVVAAGLVAAPAATANSAPPEQKCDPASGMRVAYSTSGEEKVEARGCVKIAKLDNGRWKVTGAVRAKASSTRDSPDWRLVEHPYQRSCTISRKPLLTGQTMVTEKNSATVSVNGKVEGSCVRTTLRPGTYVFTWTYDRQADRPESAVSTEGEVTFTLPGSGSAIVRPMPYPL